MTDSYPFTVSNNRIPTILERIRNAGRPAKFTHEFLKNLGFSSSNDRAVIPLLRRLGFLSEDGSPTPYYDRLKDPLDMPYVLGERMRDVYDELFAVNEAIHSAPDAEIKGALARITGKDAATVTRYFSTFKTLAGLAKFDGPSKGRPAQKEQPPASQVTAAAHTGMGQRGAARTPEFFYNIQIHLPATTDIAVYNAIFKSLRDHILG